jgi:release factor glutamine methyltransferase
MDEVANTAKGRGLRRLRDELILGVERLSAGALDSPRLDAEVLLAHCLTMSREQLLAASDLPIAAAAARRYETLLARRLQREPVAYITGKREFWSRDFAVTSDVLIPRPDTERLVEVSLLCAARFPASTLLRIVDLCTGSGAVAVTLAGELPMAQIYATDISPATLQIARGNAAAHHVAERVQFFTGDLFDALRPRPDVTFDLIVSNPPYVRRDEIVTLGPEVSRWEPPLALDGGTDGLEFYRRIAAAAPDYLAERGALVLEIGADMGSEVVALCTGTGLFREIAIHQDYAGKDRVVSARLGKN